MTPDALKSLARREASAILSGLTVEARHDYFVDLLAVAWLQGAIYAGHESLADAEIAFEKVRAEL